MDHRQSLGKRGEDLACAELEKRGYVIVDRRFRTRFGELDIVATDEETIVFCEVKTRRAGSGAPWDALDDRKRKQVRSMGAAWLAETHERPRTAELRFDAVGVILDAGGALVELVHLEGAF